MPANEYPSLSSPMPDDRTANRVPGGAESIHGSVAQRRISASVAPLAITRPSGTGNPACFSRAQLNALPPTRGRSPGAIASSVFNACRATLSGLPRSRVGSVTILLPAGLPSSGYGRVTPLFFGIARPRGFYDVHGDLLPIHSLPDELAACIASIEVVKRNLLSGEGKTEFIYKIKLWSKPVAL